MSQSNDKRLSKLCQVMHMVNSAGLTDEFIAEYLSPAEVNDILERWEIVELLVKGHTQRKVRDELNVSLAKVSRCAQILKSNKNVLEKVQAHQK